MRRDRDVAALAALLAPIAIVPLWFWLQGLSPFWGDLSYLHHPWRALAAEMIQRGELPLWNPYAYLGMPLAAEMQSATWYPGTLPFDIFPFAAGLMMFHILHYGLAACFAFLWLRKEGLGRAACFAGAAVFAGCGSLASRAPFLNHLSTLAYIPAFLLLGSQEWLLGLAFALSFLGGYPLMMAGGAAIALIAPYVLRGSAIRARPWTAAALLGFGISACLLLPALQLSFHSHRGAGLGLEDTLMYGLAFSDWRQWISPLVVPAANYSSSIFWWKTCYLGFGAWIAIVLSLQRLNWPSRTRIAAYLVMVGCLLLGGATPVSQWIWAHVSILKYVRYPGNLAYLLIPILCFLAAAGLHRHRWAPVFGLLMGLELLAYGVVSQPLMPSSYFTDAGPLVRELQASMEHRYMLSPKALYWHQGTNLLDWKRRLYGLTNLPFHLSAATNFGEPLVPTGSYNYMDHLYSESGLDAAAAYMPWSDIQAVLTLDRLPSKDLRYDGVNIWQQYRVPGSSSRTFWFDTEEGDAIPSAFPHPEQVPDIKHGVPLFLERHREDRYKIHDHTAAGWVYLAEPKIEGWQAFLDGRRVDGEPALGVFQKFKVPAGDWELHFLYAPVLWAWGLLTTCLVLFLTAAYWYNRVLKIAIK